MKNNFCDEMNMVEEKKEKALLVGIDFQEGEDFERFMEELVELVKACEMEPVGWILQRASVANKATFIGSGKVDEVKEQVEETNADIIIFVQTLSPSQIRNLQNILHMPIIDRTSLILEIFSKRAQTREAKLQVEVAKLQYTLPRLVGLHEALSRQGGASGSMSSRGLGEKKLELDRRHLEQRLAELRRELKELEENRLTQRKKRENTGIYRVALVGYTNAGKSTLMNAMLQKFSGENADLSHKTVMEKDMLFATLDTTVRRITPDGLVPFLLTDTVGFVSNLPHGLVKAFRSTLEETKEADLLLHVTDASDVNHEEQIAVTKEVLKELEADNIPVIYVYNKADICFDEKQLPKVMDNRIYLSAKHRIGIDVLAEMIQNILCQNYVDCRLLLPYQAGTEYSYLKENAIIDHEDYSQDGIEVTGRLQKKDYDRLRKYVI